MFLTAVAAPWNFSHSAIAARCCDSFSMRWRWPVLPGFFRLRLGGYQGDRWRRHRRCQRFDVAFGRVETHARQPQPANRIDLILTLDLEAAESKRMIHPAEIQMDEQADAQLVGRDVLTVICFRHSGVPGVCICHGDTLNQQVWRGLPGILPVPVASARARFGRRLDFL